MNSDDLHLTIFIVNYETSQYTNRCLESLLKQEDVSWRAIVVDNPSPEEDWKNIKLTESVSLIRNPENVGYGVACNQAAQQADPHSTHYVVLNPDTCVPPGALRAWCEAHVTEQQKNPAKLLMSGPCLLNDNGIKQKSHYRFPSFMSYWTDHSLLAGLLIARRKRAAARQPEQPGPGNSRPMQVDWVTGAAMMMMKEHWNTVGGFNPEFFLYFEDTDFCRRVHDVGGTVVYFPGTCIFHTQGSPGPGKRAKGIIRLFSGYILYMEKHFGRGKAALIALAITADMIIRITLYGTLQLVRPNDLNAARLEGYRAILKMLLRRLMGAREQ